MGGRKTLETLGSQFSFRTTEILKEIESERERAKETEESLGERWTIMEKRTGQTVKK